MRAKNFKDLSEQEIRALAISLEETDARIYADFAAGFKADYPATAKVFKEMEAEQFSDRYRHKGFITGGAPAIPHIGTAPGTESTTCRKTTMKRSQVFLPSAEGVWTPSFEG